MGHKAAKCSVIATGSTEESRTFLTKEFSFVLLNSKKVSKFRHGPRMIPRTTEKSQIRISRQRGNFDSDISLISFALSHQNNTAGSGLTFWGLSFIEHFVSGSGRRQVVVFGPSNLQIYHAFDQAFTAGSCLKNLGLERHRTFCFRLV